MITSAFGRVAMSMGYLTPQQLGQAMSIQELEFEDGGTFRHLKEICIQMRFMTREQAERALAEQQRSIGRN
jgi:hypothetical protein